MQHLASKGLRVILIKFVHPACRVCNIILDPHYAYTRTKKDIGLLENGEPLEYFVAKHRGDRSKFHMNLVRDANV